MTELTPEMQKALKLAAALGQGTDTILAHINPEEAQLLDQVTDGGSINPHTGLPEFESGGGWSGNDNSSDGGGNWNDSSSSDSGSSGGAHGDEGNYDFGNYAFGNFGAGDGAAGGNGGPHGDEVNFDFGMRGPQGGRRFKGDGSDAKGWFGRGMEDLAIGAMFKMHDIKSNPVKYIGNALVGLAPALGPVTAAFKMANAVSSMFDGPSVGRGMNALWKDDVGPHGPNAGPSAGMAAGEPGAGPAAGPDDPFNNETGYDNSALVQALRARQQLPVA